MDPCVFIVISNDVDISRSQLSSTSKEPRSVHVRAVLYISHIEGAVTKFTTHNINSGFVLGLVS